MLCLLQPFAPGETAPLVICCISSNGRKKFSKDKLNVTIDLEWGCTNFTLLDIEFSTNLSTITERNYTKALEKNKKIGEDMEQQIFDTFGQDYGHQD